MSDQVPIEEQPSSAQHAAPVGTGRRRWPWVLAAIVVVAVLGVAIFRAITQSRAQQAVLSDAFATCSLSGKDGAELADAGHTLTLDTKGEKDFIGSDIVDVACVLVATKAPSSVTTDIDQTRALDGKQTASWDGVTATWRYHPDDGLQITFTN